jgi:hypothetical protein
MCDNLISFLRDLSSHSANQVNDERLGVIVSECTQRADYSEVTKLPTEEIEVVAARFGGVNTVVVFSPLC